MRMRLCVRTDAGRPQNNTPLPPPQSVTPPLQNSHDAIAPSPEEGFDGELFSQVAIYTPLRYNLGPSQHLHDRKVVHFLSVSERRRKKKDRRFEAYQ